MTALLFFQLVALLFIFSLFTLLTCLAIGYVYFKYMPTVMQTLVAGFEDGEEFDTHWEQNRQIIDPIGQNPFEN